MPELKCPACGSKNILTNADGTRVCRKCGERTPKVQ